MYSNNQDEIDNIITDIDNIINNIISLLSYYYNLDNIFE